MNSELILYQAEDGQTKIQTRLENETVWLTQAQLIELFGKAKSTISEHIKNILRTVNWTNMQLFGISEQLQQTKKSTRPIITTSM